MFWTFFIIQLLRNDYILVNSATWVTVSPCPQYREAWMEAIKQVSERISDNASGRCVEIQEADSVEQIQLKYSSDDDDDPGFRGTKKKRKIVIFGCSSSEE